MEPDILHSFQNFIIGAAERVWVKHRACFQGRKLVPAAYMLLAFSPQQVRRLLRDRRSPNRRLPLGLPHYQLAFHSVVSSQRSSLTQHPNSPGKGKGIPAPQTGGQFREICRQESSFLRIHQVQAKVLLWQELPSISPASGACTHELGWSEAGVF